MGTPLALGIDVGATKVAFAIVDANGAVLASHRMPTHAAGDNDLSTRFRTTVRAFLADASPVACVGIGSAGPIDRSAGTISPVNIAAWRDFAIVDAAQQLAGTPRIELIGDAQAMAFGEFAFGAGRGSRNMLGVVVSTGIGGGLVLDGALHLGSSVNAGFIGHIIHAVDGDPCACGGRGCVEAYASGPSMTTWAAAHGCAAPAERFEDIALAAHHDDPVAQAAIERGMGALAHALATAAVLNDLDRIVVGGGVADAGNVIHEPLQRAFADAMRHAPFIVANALHWSALGAQAGVIGAATFALRRAFPELVPTPT